jgi:N-methylhydantoinase A
LGRLDPDHFLGGSMTLDLTSAQAAISTLAIDMQLSVEAAVAGIINIANVSIDRAVRRVSIARGYDPRRFTLLAFGGAGPLHACEVAAHLDILRVLIPRYPGVLCAFGLLVADVALDYSRSVLGLYTDDTFAKLDALLSEMLVQAKVELAQEGIGEADMIFRPTVDMRYQGQAYELSVPLQSDSNNQLSLVDAFHNLHEQTYGHALRERAVEVVNLRLQAVGIVEKPELQAEPPTGNNSPTAAFLGTKTSPTGEQMELYERDQLPIGAAFDGPALTFQFDSTVYIASGWRAKVDGYRNLILERQ